MIDFTATFAISTVDTFTAALKAARDTAALEADTDAEISLDHGLELTADLARELLAESPCYPEIKSAEIREAYRTAYLAAFLAS